MKPYAFFCAVFSAPASKLRLGLALAGIPIFGPATTFAQTPLPVYPEVGPTTHFINQDAVLSGFPEPAWYQANVPFIDLPDQTVENVYYYRTSQTLTGMANLLIDYSTANVCDEAGLLQCAVGLCVCPTKERATLCSRGP